MLDYLGVLKTFVAVMESGSMVAGARRRGYSACAVTRQMNWLARHIGLRLFEPAGRSIRPTEEAIRLVDYARAAIHEVDRFDRQARRLADDVVPAATATMIPARC